MKVFIKLLGSWFCLLGLIFLSIADAAVFTPFIEQAQKLSAQPGKGSVVIRIPAGNYVLEEPITITSETSGTQQRPVVFKVENPETTTFSSAREVPAMRQNQAGIWTCELPDGFVLDQLFVNGERAEPARYPVRGFFTMQSVLEKIDQQGGNKGIAKKATQTIELDEKTVQQLRGLDLSHARMVVLHKWDCTLRVGIELESQNKTIVTHGGGMKSWNKWKKGTRFFLQNVAGDVLTPGQWMLHGRTLSYAPRQGELLGKAKLLAPQLEKLLVIQGTQQKPVQHVRFEGMRLMHSTLNLPQGMPPNQAANVVDAAVMVDHAKNIQFINCSISKIGRYGLWIRENSHGCVVRKCLIEDLGAGGVRIGDNHLRSKTPTSDITVDNCIIRRGGRLVPCAVGVWIGQSHDNQITHNEINDFYYTGVSVGWTWGYGKSYAHHNKILHNHIHHLGHGLLSDMGAVYCLGISEGTEVSHNVVHDIESYSYGGWGLYTDEGSTGIKMENNLVYNTKCGGFHQHYGKENIIRNNIFVDGKLYQVQATRPEEHLSFEFSHNIISFDQGTLYAGQFMKIKNRINHNLIWHSDPQKITDPKSRMFGGASWQTWQKSGRDTKSVIGDPKFANPEKGDYTPRNTSLLSQIGFKTFDISQAGVRKDDPAWLKQASALTNL